MAEQVDVVILGTGTSGEDLGLRLASAGLDVVGIQDGLVGGECAYWACIPSKMMIRAATLVQEARRLEGTAGDAHVQADWGPVAFRVRNEAAGGWDDAVAVARFEKHGGRIVRGTGRLTGPRTVTVGDRDFIASRGVVVATGSKPVAPSIPGLDDVSYWTTHGAIQSDRVPTSLTVLGGGATGCEFAQVFARFGAEVTIVESGERLLGAEEPEASSVIAEAFEAEGISVRTSASAERVEADGDALTLTLAGGERTIAERLLVAVGRRIDLDDLGLDAAGIDVSNGAIRVDEHCRAADGVWAIGDVTGKALFTHVALYQGRIVEADIMGEDAPPASYAAVPRATLTDPEVGGVGMTETDARAAGIDVVTTTKRVPATFRGWLHGPGNAGIVKLIADRRAGVLVGATAVGADGGEVLGLLSLAVHARVPIVQLQSMIYAFPTSYGAVGEALGAYARGLQDVLDPAGDRSLWA
jgi:pyruvate/2-oxoglutarate dehydrogenase complex dihydrolipoamide dehydrogenase (E3) component